MLSRRDLIGRTLGTLVLSKLPWIGTPVPTNDFILPGIPIKLDSRLIRILKSPKEDIKRMLKGSISLEDDLSLKHPSIKNIEINFEGEELILGLQLENIDILQQMIAKGSGIIFSYDNEPVCPSGKFPNLVHMCSGDRLIVQHSITGFGLTRKDIQEIKRVHNI